MRRALLLIVLALSVTACSSAPDGPPQVTFTANGQSATARPTQYCDAAFADCRNDAEAPVELRVPPGTPVQVSVPAEISSTPWLIVFTTVATDGTRTDGRTPLFTPAHPTSTYELTLPQPTDRLLTAQVQQLGAPPQANEDNGGVDFPARATWVLTTTL
ncbi:DUF2771 family protein [Pseudonocardia sp. CA-107938]|uniref:DUF2771 family protein n=1 Tax=Pseudonocardia sp. CA-107938 TaxID=3240021 RepID=UPI003D940930